VTLLALHLIGGVRLLLIEFGTWQGLRKSWIQISLIGSLLCGALFIALSH
jgi:fumarate reductase subunit D